MKALIVDDEPDIRVELTEFVQSLGLETVTAANGEEALDLFFHDRDIAIILSDLVMPGLNGLDMLERLNAAADAADRVRRVIFMTGNGTTEKVIRAMHLGATEFLLKPVDLEILESHLSEAQEYVALETSRRLSEAALNARVEASQIAIRGLHRDIRRAYGEALRCLASAAEFKDPETGQHLSRIGEYAAVVAAELGWDAERCDMIRMAAALHDVGKVGMPDAILLKNGPLSVDERAVMQRHPEIGHRILSTSSYPVMIMAATIAFEHHEHFDGSGYPRGLKGNEIALEAAITSLVDVYDALRSQRPYKDELAHEAVLDVLRNGDGRTDPAHFNPEVMAAFLGVADRIDAIFNRLHDGMPEPGVGEGQEQAAS